MGRVLKNPALACAPKYLEGEEKAVAALLAAMSHKPNSGTRAKKPIEILAEMPWALAIVNGRHFEPRAGHVTCRSMNHHDWGQALGLTFICPPIQFLHSELIAVQITFSLRAPCVSIILSGL